MSSTCKADVILVSELFPPTVGGSAILLENLYRRLENIAVTVVTDAAASRPDGAASSLPLVTLPMHQRGWGLLNRESARTYLSVAKAIGAARSSKRTIAYCARALPEGLSALIARLFFGGPPYVCWTHGEELITYQTSRELRLLLGFVHRHAAAVIANSDNTRRMLLALRVPSDKISVVYPGVDAERFIGGSRIHMRARLGLEDELVLLSVGRLQSRKGHDLVIRALRHVREQMPDVRYVVVGEGDERARLDRLVSQEGVNDLVSFVGRAGDRELADYYAAADIFIHPNRIDVDGDIEGFGMVFLEAAAAGLPVIGGNSGGVPEAVEHDVTGLLVDGRDVDELVSAVVHMATSPSLRRRMGEAGRDRAATRFAWAESVRALAQVHASLQQRLWPA